MGVINWARERFARNETAVRLAQVFSIARPLGPIRDLGQYFGAYYDSVVFRACVDEIATSFAEAPLIARRKGPDGKFIEDAKTKALDRLLESPNPAEQLSGYDLRNRIAVDLAACGNAFVRILRSGADVPAALWPLQATKIKIKLDAKFGVEYYAYGQRDSEAKKYDPKDIIHFKSPDPCSDHWGLPPAARREIMIDDHASRFIQGFWENGGIPSALLKLKAKGVPKAERQRIEEAWMERYSAADGVRVAAIDADVEFERVGQDFSELRLSELFGYTESRICAALGVPPIVVGVRTGLMYSTYANYKSARRSFWEETMATYFVRIGSKLSLTLGAEFGGVTVLSDLAKVEALQESQEDRRQFGVTAWNAGIMTQNEARQMAGLAPVEGGDVFRPNVFPGESTPSADTMPSNVTEMPAA